MQHLDEGTIHAWLDGALSADEAARVEQHGRECARCAEAIAEARGLAAGASRILSALDEVPAVVPRERVAGSGLRVANSLGQLSDAEAAPLNAGATRYPLPATRPFWSRPAILAAAASVVLMVGSVLVVNRAGVETGFRNEPTAGAGAPAERAADTASESADAFAASPAEQDRAAARDGRAGSASTRAPATRRALPPGGTAAGGATRGTAPPSVEVAPANESREMFAQKTPEIMAGKAKAADVGKAVPLAPPAPAPVDASSRFADVAPSVMRADTPAARLSAEASRAMQRRTAARARSERAMPSAGAAPPVVASGVRGDTSYRLRVDTVTVTQTDTVTVVVESPDTRANLRDPNVRIPPAIIRISGCYRVLEGRLPRLVTLTTERIWSGVAEQQFVARASGAKGYWSQPSTGDVHIVIAGGLATARIDPSTGELRGRVHRGGKSERFVARRGC